MNDITALIATMKAAAIRAKAATEDYVANRMSMSVCFSECEEFNRLTDGPDNILALVEALETKEEQRANWFHMVQKLGEDLDLAEKRIAELENAASEPVAWTDEVELRAVEKDGCGYLFKANPITPHADPRRVIKLYTVSPAQESRTVTVKLPALNDDLIAILGRPNFMCAHLAELLRKSGEEIKRKSEHEQATIIHWFLGIYLEHGDKWESVAKADIQARAAGIQVIEGEGQ